MRVPRWLEAKGRGDGIGEPSRCAAHVASHRSSAANERCGSIATGRGKLQVQPCPQCSVSDGRPEKSGLSRWARSGTRPPVGGVYLAAGRDRLRSCRHVWRFMLPAADQAGNRRAEDGRKPEQPELRDVGSASKQRRTGASRRVDRSVGDRDQEQVNKR